MMKFGVMFPHAPAGSDGAFRPEFAIEAARITEELGFESIWEGEHVIVPVEYQKAYPHSETGEMAVSDDAAFQDPLVWLSFLAASTRTLRLGTAVVILPQRQPVLLAKEAATLDVLSNGRLILGVGMGWMREESEALGVAFEGRGRRADEYINAIRELWGNDEASFNGEFVKFHRARSYPKPVQKGGVPIVIGGHSRAAARRAGRCGNGLFALAGDPAAVVDLQEQVALAAIEAGRNPADIEITVGKAPAFTDDSPLLLLDGIKAYADIGVSRMVLFRVFDRDIEQLKSNLGFFSDHVISRL